MNQTEPSDYESENEKQLTLFEFINEMTSDIKDWETLIRLTRRAFKSYSRGLFITRTR